MAKLIIFGDIKSDQDISIDPSIRKICKDADLVIANLEGPFVNYSKPRADKKGRHLYSNESLRKIVEDLEINILNFGNNHILDFGLDGLSESIKFSEELKIDWVGACDGKEKNKYFLLDEENKVAILSFSHREGPMAEVGLDGVGPYALPDFSIIEADIYNFNRKGYSVIVNYHGGEEFFSFPWPRRYAWSEQLLKAGALLVVGHHSHSIQPVLKLNKGYLALGLGNTYFHTPYQEAHIGTNEGIFLEVDTEKNTVNYHSLNSNWEEVSLTKSSKNSLFPIKIDETRIMNLWCIEARNKVYFNSLKNKKNNRGMFKKLIGIIMSFLSLSKSSLSSIRDKDILIACIPFLGKYILSKDIRKSPKDFKF